MSRKITSDYELSTCIKTDNNKIKFKDLRDRENIILNLEKPNLSDIKTVRGTHLSVTNDNNVEIARVCGSHILANTTNVHSCLTYKKPKFIITSLESTPASMEITFGSMPAANNVIMFVVNGITYNIRFVTSGGTDSTFDASTRIADVDFNHSSSNSTTKIATVVETLFDTLSNYDGTAASNVATLTSDVIVGSTYDISLTANTYSGASIVITDGKGPVTLQPSDSGALVVFNTANARVILPDSGINANLGCTYTFLTLVDSTTHGQKVECADTTNEKIYGAVIGIDTDSSNALNIYTAAAGNNYSAVSFNGTTTGGANSHITLTAIAGDQWAITSGLIYQTGSPATPFATS